MAMKAEQAPGAEPNPAFGKADLSNCETEQIHLAGAIQPHGALLVAAADTLEIVQASTNAAEFLDLPRAPLGATVAELPGNLGAQLLSFNERDLARIPAAIHGQVGRSGATFDCLLHHVHPGVLVLEFERAAASVDVAATLRAALERIAAVPSLQVLGDVTAQIFKTLTGYDRVMVYRFDENGHGEVYAESREPQLEPFLGNRYPASDIPHIARRLYEKNRIRLLSDVNSTQIPLHPQLCPLNGQDLDMSLCALRSMSPIHVQYLKNMGVSGTLVASLMVGGRLWGLISCHHYAPRLVSYEMRTQCELLAEAVGTRIAALESFVQARAELAVRRIEQHMRAAINRHGDWRSALFGSADTLLQPLSASGAALMFEDQVITVGDVPATDRLRDIAHWLDRQPRKELFATASLREHGSEFIALCPGLCGLIAAPISRTPGEYLMWIRPERLRTVTWGGNPNEPVIVGDDPTTLSPRRSFAKWYQLVQGTSDSWSEADVTAASLIVGSVADVINQFRSVRALIARSQFEELQGLVRGAEQGIMICDASGQILLINDALRELLPNSGQTLHYAHQLGTHFADAAAARTGIAELIDRQLPWHAETELETGNGRRCAILVRADPVISPRNQILGFVILLTDISAQQAAEQARRRFQERIIDRDALSRLRLDKEADAQFRTVMAAILENAELAALEITDGLNPTRMPEMLDGVQSSVARSAELLEVLLRHATRASRH